MNVERLYKAGAVLALTGLFFVSFMGMTRMFHDGQSSFVGMGCEDGMSATCFVSNSLNHLNAHGEAFRLFSLAVSITILLIGFLLLVSVVWWNPMAVAPPLTKVIHLFKTAASESRLCFSSWLAIRFRLVPSFS